jgi:hypothetical protein
MDVRRIGIFDFTSLCQVIRVPHEIGFNEIVMRSEDFLRLWDEIRELHESLDNQRKKKE